MNVKQPRRFNFAAQEPCTFNSNPQETKDCAAFRPATVGAALTQFSIQKREWLDSSFIIGQELFGLCRACM